ncbi:hypothetical protein [Leptolyngbya sp. KIOST-1]|uniref:hypothetical protein n=1 Tax=Leptolyngbya sp. KIOST-1 TaxID=1229172 RepID=UPI0012E06E75|nr:hypothetical protein [Leptolyngbya sp. KIOST-1]
MQNQPPRLEKDRAAQAAAAAALPYRRVAAAEATDARLAWRVTLRIRPTNER